MLGAALPEISTAPGERSAQWIDVLARTECPALTTRRARRAEKSGASHDPIVWTEARGANVRDADGNVYVDMTAGFGVAASGHAHPSITRAIQTQSQRLLHALGDVHPSDVKIELLQRLAALAPFPEARVILGLNGSDAIAAALKTALLATKKPGVLAFEGGYHGLMYAPLALCGYSKAFREPFDAHLNPHVRFAPYPDRDVIDAIDRVWDESIGAVVIEPALARGGVHFADPRMLDAIADRCRDRGALLIADEIFTGLGRTGAMWAHGSTRVDVICAGKALGGGMPLSACIARAEVMAAWGDPDGEAIHTATFAGHPLGCAAALAQLDTIASEDLIARAASVGARWLASLQSKLRNCKSIRGRGLMIGIDLGDGARTLRLVRRLLERGWITLPAGAGAEVLALNPPLNIDPALLDAFTATLCEVS